MLPEICHFTHAQQILKVPLLMMFIQWDLHDNWEQLGVTLTWTKQKILTFHFIKREHKKMLLSLQTTLIWRITNRLICGRNARQSQESKKPEPKNKNSQEQMKLTWEMENNCKFIFVTKTSVICTDNIQTFKINNSMLLLGSPKGGGFLKWRMTAMWEGLSLLTA